MKIIFMGTPDFAVASLQKLVEAGKNVVAVITAMDKPAGRGKKLKASAVKEYAISQDIDVLQPKNLKHPDFIENLRTYQADVQIVVAFRMLPAVVFEMPPLGTINLHGSLLPDYRGAAPINWAVINGEKETGVTTFFIQQQIDTGKIIFQESILVGPDDNVGLVHDKLMSLGAGLVLKTIEALESGEVPQIAQDDSKAIHAAPKIYKDDCKVDWSKNARKVHDFIRGLSPYPSAFTFIGENRIKLFESQITNEMVAANDPFLLTDNKTYLKLACKDYYIEILELQAAGKRKTKTKDFLSGNQL
ncbi:UNVERIFIED_CONTAM: hypothetical protein GTU68_027415 [Idotea baltica]|nr:hypothetical protein [Idotea baltica]